MFPNRLLMTALVTVAILTASAFAQKNELTGIIGRTFISDQTVPNTNFFDNTVHFGKGLSFEGDYARRLRGYRWGVLWVEAPVIYNPDEDLNYFLNQIPKQYSSVFITPAVRVNFLENLAFSPWISFGGGLGIFVASNELLFGTPNPKHRLHATGAIQGGVGFDVGIPKTKLCQFRFEARDDWTGVPPIYVNTGKSRQHNYYVGGGAVFHF